MFKIINNTDNILLQLLANHLFNSNSKINLNNVSLTELFDEAKVQTVVAIAFDALPKEAANIDAETYATWQNLSFVIMQKTLKNNYANAALTKLLDENCIEHCTIKGYTSASYYPKPSLRQMGDIDFLIKKDDYDKAKQLLLENDFKFIDDEHDFHTEFKKNKILYEMHLRVSRLPEDKQHLFKYLDNAIDQRRTINSINVLGELHHGITMLLHMQRHMLEGSGIGLRHLVDWAVFANSFDNDKWINIFETTLKEMGLWIFAKTISKACSIYLKMPEKEWFADADTTLSQNLIFDIIKSGNFGRKELDERYQQKMFHNQKYKNKNTFARFFLSAIDNVYSWAPFYKKHKILLPIGFIAYCFRIGFQVLFKNKKLNILKLYKEGNKQYNTYSQLRFFEKQ